MFFAVFSYLRPLSWCFQRDFGCFSLYFLVTSIFRAFLAVFWTFFAVFLFLHPFLWRFRRYFGCFFCFFSITSIFVAFPAAFWTFFVAFSYLHPLSNLWQLDISIQKRCPWVISWRLGRLLFSEWLFRPWLTGLAARIKI